MKLERRAEHRGVPLVAGQVTFLDAAGTSYPDSVQGKPAPELDGRSLMPVLRGEPGGPSRDRLLVSGFQSDKRMVRAGDWKIVRVKGEPWELYNLAADPTETHNLAEERPNKVESMVQRFEEWKADQEASFERMWADQPDGY